MGSDGGIYLYKDEDIRKYNGPGDIDRMLQVIPRHYTQNLFGETYHTFYYGTHFVKYDPFDLDSFDYSYAKKLGIDLDELDNFVEFLQYKCPYEYWELWT